MFFRRKEEENKDVSETANPWSSYSDMMAALLLVFILIMFYFVYQYLDAQETHQAIFEQQSTELAEKETLLSEQQMQLAEQQEELSAQREKLDAQQGLLAEQEEKIEKIVGVKASIIMELTRILDESGISVNIDLQTGAITMDSSIMFANNSYELTKEGKKYLRNFLPLYFGTLLSSDNGEYISEIIIEGHTDTSGDYDYNLMLSQERARSVVVFCLDTVAKDYSAEEMDNLRAMLTANGRSYSRPVYDENGNVDMAASRRVEFKFRLKDSEMIEEMQAILDGTEK